MELLESTWTETDGADTDLAVLPVGSTEQHGPHAPLGTDLFTAQAIARAAAEEIPAVVGPTIPVGIAAEHRHFSGSLWVSEDTFRAYVRETCESLAAHGWDRIVLVNGHGGNVDALRELCGQLTREGTAYAVPFTWFDAVDPAELGEPALEMGHGGPLETSLLQHLDAEHIRADRLEAAAAGAADRWGEWQSGVNLAYDTAEFSENGVVGDPSAGSAELGAKLLDAATEQLTELLAVVEQRDLSRPDGET